MAGGKHAQINDVFLMMMQVDCNDTSETVVVEFVVTSVS